MERYVLTTSAHNEGKLIGNAIWEISKQTIHPPRWVFISNRSTDGTGNIDQANAETLSFLRIGRLDTMSFGKRLQKVDALMAATKKISRWDRLRRWPGSRRLFGERYL